MTSRNIYSAVIPRLDLETATIRASKSNDLLPPRHEDKLGGELGKRFSEAIHRRMLNGEYEPRKAEFVPAPKRKYTTRPAALLTLIDRTVYEALVHSLRQRIEDQLLRADVIFWPRGTEAKVKPSWHNFETSPLQNEVTHIVVSDITGFYDSIPHKRLCSVLSSATGRKEVVAALEDFLNRIMNSERGLPQGVEASDPLATLYMNSVDRAMLRAGFLYNRFGDDIRVGASSFSEARRAIALLEEEVRKISLILNESKTRIISREGYEEDLRSLKQARDENKERLVRLRMQALHEDESEFNRLLKEVNRVDIGWSVFYHFDMTFDEALEELREHLKPSDLEAAAALFHETVAQAPGKENALSSTQFHQRLVDAFRTLQAAKSPDAIASCGQLLINHPDETTIISKYLIAVAPDHGEPVVLEAEKALSSSQYRTPVEMAWLLRILAQHASGTSPHTRDSVRMIAEDEAHAWIVRMEAIKVLALCGSLEERLMARVSRLAPEAYQTDIIAAAYYMKQHAEWPNRFLEAAENDLPVQQVVIRKLADGR